MSETVKTPKEHDSSYRFVIAFVAFASQVALASCMGALSPMGPYIREALGMNFTQFGLLFTMANLGAAIMLWVTGPLVDRFGVRQVLLAGHILMGILLVIAGRLTTATQLIALEFCMGLCNAVAGPTGTKMVSTWARPSERGTMLGIKQAGIPVTGIIAGFVLPPICATSGWRTAYTAVGATVIIVGIISALLYKDSSVLLAQKNDAHKPSFKETAPMLANRDFILLCIGGFILMGTQFALSSNASNYGTAVLSANGMDSAAAKVLAGQIYSYSTAAGVLGRVIWGMVAGKSTSRKTILYSNIMATVLLIALAVGGDKIGTGSMWLCVIYGFAGFGWSGLYLAAAVPFVPHTASATAVSVALSLSFFGMLSFSPIFGAVVDRAGWTTGWWFLAIANVVGLLVTFLVKEKENDHNA